MFETWKSGWVWKGKKYSTWFISIFVSKKPEQNFYLYTTAFRVSILFWYTGTSYFAAEGKPKTSFTKTLEKSIFWLTLFDYVIKKRQ